MDEWFKMPLTGQTLIALAATVVIVGWLFNRTISNRKSSKLRLPPSPKGLPILGVTGEMVDQSVKAWRKFQRWTDELDAKGARQADELKVSFGLNVSESDLLRIETLNQTSMIINTASAAHALLNKRGGIYADRPVRQLALLCSACSGSLYEAEECFLHRDGREEHGPSQHSQ